MKNAKFGDAQIMGSCVSERCARFVPRAWHEQCQFKGAQNLEGCVDVRDEGFEAHVC